MTPKAAARKIRAIGRDFERACKAAERQSLRDALQTARALSHGPYKLDELAKMDHPYAKRHKGAHPLLAVQDAAIANMQSEDMAQGWRKQGPQAQGNTLVGTVYNNTPEAAYFSMDSHPNGTKYMIARPLQLLLLDAIEPARLHRLQQVADRFF